MSFDTASSVNGSGSGAATQQQGGGRAALVPAGMSRSPMFGVPLENSIDAGQELPWIVVQTVHVLRQRGLECEGVFRLSGSAERVGKLKKLYDSGRAGSAMTALRDEGDVHTVAGVLKLWLRELPDPLLTSQLLPAWLDTYICRQFLREKKTVWLFIAFLFCSTSIEKQLARVRAQRVLLTRMVILRRVDGALFSPMCSVLVSRRQTLLY